MERSLDPERWGLAIEAQPDPALQERLLERLRAPAGPRSLSVTELLDPRASYWKRIHPVPASPERTARMRSGQETHRVAGALLAAPSDREVRRSRDGIVARIDLLDDRVTELKTTRSNGSFTGSDVRAAYLDQLAAYGALLGRRDGRIVLIDPSAGEGPAVAVFDLELPPPEPTWSELLRRAERLRAAWSSGDPRTLPRCPWRGRGCEFQSSQVCDCTGLEPDPDPPLFDGAPTLIQDAERGEALARLLSEVGERPVAARFRDLLYPRRSFFEQRSDTPAPAWAPAGGGAEPDLWRRISDEIDSGALGGAEFVSPVGGEPDEKVLRLDGAPLLIKTSRARNPATAARLLSDQPQYALELALRCAAVGATEGRLLLGYERAGAEADRLRVIRLRFAPDGSLERLATQRAGGLRSALLQEEPGDLPSCPPWMYQDCPYRDACGCGPAEPPADQR